MWGIILQRDSQISLSRQIYKAISENITKGKIKSGEALPSTREMARQFGVSRNTVCEAYDMLLAEGFAISRQGAPTRVAEGLFIKRPDVNTQTQRDDINKRPNIYVDFDTGKPDLRLFPKYQWLSLLRNAYDQMPIEQFGYTGPDGLEPLRCEISAWLLRSKGLTVDHHDIFITAGATHALHVLCTLLCANGKGIIMEDPCHMGMLRVLQSQRYPVFAVPVDSHGLVTDRLEKCNAGAIYVTPSHQFPLGGILPASRRAALIRFARENGMLIIEDDYDSEFRYCGEPVAPLYAMDPEHVIYVGTFSKALFPALRIGYAILPPALQRQWRRLRTHTDVQNPPFEQLALAEYLRTRKFDRYVQKMRRVYAARRQVLLDALAEAFGTSWKPWGDAAGLHIALAFQDKRFDGEFEKIAADNGISIATVDCHSIGKDRHLDKLLIGYGHLEPDEIRSGVCLLKSFMSNYTQCLESTELT